MNPGKGRSRRTLTPVTILDAISDPALFGPWFAKPTMWTAWFAFLAALFGLSMPPEQMAVFKECTGRSAVPTTPFSEAWLICGHRSGKSFILALVATFLATFRDYREYLAPGERATIMVIASDRKQARIIMRYIRAMLKEIPMLAALIEREQAEGFDLNNRVTIEVATASYRRTRGYAIAAALLDELAFWPTDDAAEPDI
jgi:phage terminase large subunit-like protein